MYEIDLFSKPTIQTNIHAVQAWAYMYIKVNYFSPINCSVLIPGAAFYFTIHGSRNSIYNVFSAAFECLMNLY